METLVQSNRTKTLDLSRVRRHFQKKSGRQTDKQCFFLKRHFKSLINPQSFSSTFQGHKNAIKSLKNRFVTDRWTDRRTDRKVAYRVA